METPLTDAELRAMRDRVFAQATSDAGWEACRENWLRPDSIAWLKQHDPARRAGQ